jgi:hypothetical protein
MNVPIVSELMSFKASLESKVQTKEEQNTVMEREMIELKDKLEVSLSHLH